MSSKGYVLATLIAVIPLTIAFAQNESTAAHPKVSTQGRFPAPGTPHVQIPGATGVSTTIKPGGSVIPGTRVPSRDRREPCWQVAGVSRSAMEQRHALALQTRQQVEAVCADSSLSGAQKQQRIRKIHQQERIQVEALVSPAQREAMHVCQQSRGAGGGPSVGGSGEGPCGNRPASGRRLNPPVLRDEPPQD